MSIRIQIDEGKLTRIVGGMAERFVVDLARQVRNSSVVRTPVDTGLLRASYKTRTRFRRLFKKVTIYNKVEYGLPVHEGRGEIVPRRAKALRFRSRTGTVVFAKRVKPVDGRPFMRTATVAVARKHRFRVIRNS